MEKIYERMKKYKPQNHLSKSRRAAKSWQKESSVKRVGERGRDERRLHDEDDAFVPLSAVSMTLRLKNIQHKEHLDTAALTEGKVVNSTGRSWIVEYCNDDNLTMQCDCVTPRSIVTENPDSTLVAVGDVVMFKLDDSSGEIEALPTGVIALVQERKSKLARLSAGSAGMEQVIVSNIDHLVILMAAADPFYNRRLIDRYLIAAEQGGLEPIICINKIDLMNEKFVREDLTTYTKQLSIPVVITSAVKGKGVVELSSMLAGKTTVFSGPSGVGKSTLVNILLGEELQDVTEVSRKTQRGLHTTTFSVLFPLPNGGYIADTPGIREFGMWDVAKDELAFYFHDFDAYRLNCRYPMCTHTHEPECAVKAAVAQGLIDEQRYQSYVSILETLE